MSGEATTPTHTRTMRYWLGRTLRETREAARDEGGHELALYQIALYLRDSGIQISEATLSRLETDSTGWPRKDLDAIVAAYADLCGIEDPRDLWRRALDSWVSRGGIPALGIITPYRSATILALEARQRSQQRAGESRSKPTSKGKSRKAQ